MGAKPLALLAGVLYLIGLVSPAKADQRPTTRPSSDLERTLTGHKIDELRLDSVTFEQALDILATKANVNIAVNWNELEAAKIYRTTPIHLTVRDVSAGSALRVLLEVAAGEKRLGYRLDDGFIWVSTYEDARELPFPRVYDVRDILQEQMQWASTRPRTVNLFTTQPALEFLPEVDDRQEDLIRAIQDAIEPHSWKDNDGQGSIHGLAGRIVISATLDVHQKVASLLDDLRHGRTATATSKPRK